MTKKEILNYLELLSSDLQENGRLILENDFDRKDLGESLIFSSEDLHDVVENLKEEFAE